MSFISISFIIFLMIKDLFLFYPIMLLYSRDGKKIPLRYNALIRTMTMSRSWYYVLIKTMNEYNIDCDTTR